MNLPKVEEYLKAHKFLLLVVISFTLITLLVVWLYLFSRPATNKSSGVSDPTKRTTITYQGKKISVPAEVLEITPEALQLSITRNDPVKLVQIMSLADWQKAHLHNATFISLDQIKIDPGALQPNDYLVLISKDGQDSAQAAKTLIEKFGFSSRSTFSLAGGLEAWIMKGYKVEK